MVAADPADLAGCGVAFVAAEHAEAALDAGVDDVLACSLTPFATRLASVPPMVLDAALEIPAHGDHFGGRPREARLEVEGRALVVPALAVTGTDRVLTGLDPATTAGLGALLGVLAAGAAAVLLRSGDPERAVAAEAVTAVVGPDGLLRA